MGLFNRLFARLLPDTSAHTRESIPIESILPMGLGFSPYGGSWGSSVVGTTGLSGITVDASTALATPTVYACISIIANQFASLPGDVVSEDGGEKLKSHPTYKLLKDEPNEYMSAFDFKKCMITQCGLFGSSYAFIEKDTLGYPTSWLPLPSMAVTPWRVNGRLVYSVMLNGHQHVVTPDQMLVLHWDTADGICGMSPVQQCPNLIGLARALEQYANKFFSNGAQPGGVLEFPTGMNSEARKSFIADWKALYSGIRNAWGVIPLQSGMAYKATGISPRDALAIEEQIHTNRQIAMLFQVPGFFLGDLEKSTMNNTEMGYISFREQAIAPRVISWEQELERKCILEREKPILRVRFNMDSILRSTTLERYQAQKVAIEAGFKSRNTVCAEEGLPPVEGGDVVLTPLNMAPAATREATREAVEHLQDSIESSIKRLATKEVKALERAAKKHGGDELMVWGVEFLAGHRELVTEILGDQMAVAGALGLQVRSMEQVVEDYCAGVREIISDVSTGKTKLEAAVDKLDERPLLVATRLLKGK